MKAEKTALRKQVMKKIEELPDDYIAESDRGIFDNLTKLPEFQKAKTIFTFYSMGREPDTRRLVEYALGQHKTVALPVCAKCGVMDARAIASTEELSLSSYQLLEPLGSTQVVAPEALDFIIVPALAYDREGYRLGYGGGYYDRFLLKTKAFTAGIARERLLMDAVPREAHDVAVRCVVTEKEARLR
ncbi:5-formyltetrahydrofolate cyclo-ligase [Sporobacter termitidis DSM 10068]|uniref:5-formyltetrahydrofolate cyclo-ligase n=1 Tax=Sporobacter termitidis DSM 10068 TaxID=1123282 RepID=A0A1M5YN13_9FIRM|nr:5-formyltetrahydrofolate cyclo-ligase [Sporobacter termitidis]SHI13214.1 5-formyltetrahydrofolate cyclo-ligase [Sporobacter termitidis DSM 10068]